MLGLQSCPKCKGKLYIDSDFHGWYVECLMCGFSRDLEELTISGDNSVEIKLKLSENEVSDFLPDSRAKYG
jgi:hypothetical protein